MSRISTSLSKLAIVSGLLLTTSGCTTHEVEPNTTASSEIATTTDAGSPSETAPGYSAETPLHSDEEIAVFQEQKRQNLIAQGLDPESIYAKYPDIMCHGASFGSEEDIRSSLGVVSAEEVDRQLEFMRNAPAEVKQMSERNSHALVGTLTVMNWADKEQCDLYGEGIQLAG